MNVWHHAGSIREQAGVRSQTEWSWSVALYLGLSSAAAGAESLWQIGNLLDSAWGAAFRPGAALGIALGLVSALFILFDLGRWPRFYRAVLRPSTAWISRGFLLLLAFDGLGVLQIASWILPLEGLEALLSIPLILLALALLVYGGLLLRSTQSFPLWMDPLQVAVYLVSSLLGGCGILQLGSLWSTPLTQSRPLGIATALLALLEALLLALLMLRLRASAPAGSASVDVLVGGKASRLFWFGAGALGLALPIALELTAWSGATDRSLTWLSGASALAGVLFLRYSVLTGAYRPVEVSFRGLGPWQMSR